MTHTSIACRSLVLALLLSGCHDTPEAARNEAPSHAEVLQLTPEARKVAGLVSAAAGPAKIAEVIPLYGTLKPNAEAVRNITARFPGVVRSVSVAVGDAVRQDAVLATVESNESLQVYSVTSPLAGVVTERFVNGGEHASGDPLFTVANLSTLWAEFSLFPRDRARIQAGQSVRIRVAEDDAGVTGKVIFISPLGSAATQSLTARVVLDNREGRLSPGLHVRGDVLVSDTEVPLAVPVDAVQSLEHGPSVFLDGKDGLAPRAVKLGRSDGVNVEIVSGLSAGDVVVVKGSFVLKAELGKDEAAHEH